MAHYLRFVGCQPEDGSAWAIESSGLGDRAAPHFMQRYPWLQTGLTGAGSIAATVVIGSLLSQADSRLSPQASFALPQSDASIEGRSAKSPEPSSASASSASPSPVRAVLAPTPPEVMESIEVRAARRPFREQFAERLQAQQASVTKSQAVRLPQPIAANNQAGDDRTATAQPAPIQTAPIQTALSVQPAESTATSPLPVLSEGLPQLQPASTVEFSALVSNSVAPPERQLPVAPSVTHQADEPSDAQPLETQPPSEVNVPIVERSPADAVATACAAAPAATSVSATSVSLEALNAEAAAAMKQEALAHLAKTQETRQSSSPDRRSDAVRLVALTPETAMEVAHLNQVAPFRVFQLSEQDYQRLWMEMSQPESESAPTYGFIDYQQQVVVLPPLEQAMATGCSSEE